ncbi:hypothetical protein EB796_002854 [Bugula neritina]|uniref:Uncharacterized protein n=1 Tax=Bugula neritina TaxID=10212 RepID=A0A7J7KL52_BUGNE|nr:hypothetical protein EB796_002854 [Bugula neritina]
MHMLYVSYHICMAINHMLYVSHNFYMAINHMLYACVTIPYLWLSTTCFSFAKTSWIHANRRKERRVMELVDALDMNKFLHTSMYNSFQCIISANMA